MPNTIRISEAKNTLANKLWSPNENSSGNKKKMMLLMMSKMMPMPSKPKLARRSRSFDKSSSEGWSAAAGFSTTITLVLAAVRAGVMVANANTNIVMSVGVNTERKLQLDCTPAGKSSSRNRMGAAIKSLMMRPKIMPPITPTVPMITTSTMTASSSRARGAPNTRKMAKSRFDSFTVVIISAFTIRPIMPMLSKP